MTRAVLVASPPDTSAERYLTPRELGAQLKIPTGTLAQWRYLRTGPRWYKMNGHIRYSQTDVDRYITNSQALLEEDL